MRIGVIGRIALLVASFVATASVPAPAGAQSTGLASTVQVPIAATGASGIEGLALLGAAEDGGTAFQVLVTGAQAGSVAVVHAGSCEEWDPQPVALLGDVGAGASLQVTVPVRLETLADGSHALVLHEGLDMSTGLACGLIPRVEPPPGTDDATAGVEVAGSLPPAPAGATYTGPRFGFSVTWDETWQDLGDTPLEGVDRVRLQHGTSSLDIAAYRLETADASSCIATWEDDLFTGVREGRVTDLAPLLEADGSRIAGGDASHAWAAYGYTFQSAAVQTADYRECWSLPDGVMVELGQVTTVDQYPAEAEARAALLATLVLPAAAITPSMAPEPVASPIPTADARCAGVPAWVEATRGRLDRITDLQAEADAFIGDGNVDGYVASVGAFAGEVRALLAQQESDLVPDLAQSANETAIATFGHYIAAGETLYRHITVSASAALYQRFVDELKEANEGAGKVRTQLGDLEGQCPPG